VTISVSDIVENAAPDAIDDNLTDGSYDLPVGGAIVSQSGDTTVVTGKIVATGDHETSVDQWTFSHNGGPLTIDVLTESGSNYTDIDGDGQKIHIDSMMRLYDSNGNQVAYNDDSNQGTDDGSTNDSHRHIQDSYIDLSNLPAGEYTLAIGSWQLTNAEALSGVNDNSDSGMSEATGAYQITFKGDMTFDTPTAITTDEDTSTIIPASTLLANDTDADGDTLTISSVQDATHGTVSLDADGNVVFTPEANYTGEATFTYTVSDGQGGSDTASVTVNVTGSDDIVADKTVEAPKSDIHVDLTNPTVTTIQGSTQSGADRLEAGDENSIVAGYNWNHNATTNGTDADDSIVLRYGNDQKVNGGAGDDYIQNGNSDSAHRATIHGDDGNDYIKLTQNDDQKAYGDAGNDTIEVSSQGWTHRASIYGGEGDDKAIMQRYGSGNLFDGGDGNDTLVLQGTQNDYRITDNNDGSYNINSINSWGNVTGDFSMVAKNIESLEFTNGESVQLSNTSTSSTTYSYDFTVHAELTDTDGSESLSTVKIDANTLPKGTTLYNGDTQLTANADGFYEVDVTNSGTNANGGSITLTIQSDTPLSKDDVSGIKASVTATESNGGDEATTYTAVLVDGVCEGVEYETSSGITGITDSQGNFSFREGDSVTFSVGGVVLGTATASDIASGHTFLQDIADVDRGDLNDEYLENMATFLQSIDSDLDSDNIVITEQMREALADVNIDLRTASEQEVQDLVESVGGVYVDESNAMDHVQQMLQKYTGMSDSEFDVHTDDIQTATLGIGAPGGVSYVTSSGLEGMEIVSHSLTSMEMK
ncbi:MAG: DVUA0089 family protein, partial [Campylobacterales bacterium]|nr:DVUA0089 family protein [Campylobacterales bacterium]